jgi:mono/diheme cytochrome c family protein
MKQGSLLGALALVAAAAIAVAGREPQQQSQDASHGKSVLPAGNIAHGRYLAERVAMCIECHSRRDASGNILPDGQFEGAPIPFKPPEGWAERAPRNKGLPGYTDEEALRLLTQGAIGRDGRQLQPPMPRFRMSRQDAADVIAFLRSLR